MTTREVILDGALEVMRARGLARTTTKEIARASGFSEATLYKLFADKTDLVLCVLAERLPRVTVMTDGVAGLVGKNSVKENLTAMIAEIERFYEASLPLGMSLFSDVELLARETEALRARGAGPGVLAQRVVEYLRGEQAGGRVSTSAPIDAAATALIGACLQHAFLDAFNDRGLGADPAEDLRALADGVVAVIFPAICP
jgi:AcrR family transcriptional regulator